MYIYILINVMSCILVAPNIETKLSIILYLIAASTVFLSLLSDISLYLEIVYVDSPVRFITNDHELLSL